MEHLIFRFDMQPSEFKMERFQLKLKLFRFKMELTVDIEILS